MSDAHSRLDVFVGEWTLQVDMPDAPPGRSVFEWALDGQYLLQRTTFSQPEIPDSLAIVAVDGEGYRQHYFDSRGVVRLYRMTLRESVWTLLRTEPDFTPLQFAQRFVGTFSPDRNSIVGRWEQSHDGGHDWEPDFGVTYVRER